MDGFSTVVLLALLSLGRASPPSTVTQIPRMDEDMIREVATDGFIVNQQLLSSLTTQAPHNQTMMEREEEGSAMGESPEEPMTSTTQASATQASATQASATQDSATQDSATQDSATQASATQASATQESATQDSTTQAGIIQAGIIQATSGPFTSTPALPAQSSTMMAILESISLSKSEDRTMMEPRADGAPEETTTDDLLSTMSDWGSGEEHTSNMRSHFDGSGGSEEPPIIIKAVRGQSRALPWGIENGLLEQSTDRPGNRPLHQIVTEKPSGHVTPEWIIIVGFLVGLAALVLLCVAIATREKWNGPHQFNQTGVTLAPANQQREVEMEFLPKERPKENSKAGEYTVISLDELPDSYSS